MVNIKSPDSITTVESRLSCFCAHLIEACWLGAVGLLPLLFEPNAVNGFDSIKMAALRILGILTIAAMLVQAVESLPKLQTREFSFPFKLPLWLLACFGILFSALLSATLSVDPWRSFWGSSQWLQGTFTLICELGVFAGIAANLRSDKQLKRLVSTALAASIPVAIYALLQRAGMDPVAFAEFRDTAISFAGHPTFLAGYLLMLMPLCVWRLWWSLHPENKPAGRAEPAFFAAILLLQFAAFMSTGKRGPFVALMLAGALGLLLLAACHRRFRWAAWGIGASAAGGIFLMVLALLVKEGVRLDSIPILERLSMVVPLGAQTGDAFRASLWGKATDVVLAAKPFLFPDGTPDRWHLLRPFIGYGPETLQGILPHYWLWVTGGPALLAESRFHNMFWETWQSVGCLGIAALWAFYVGIFWAGTRALGLASAKSGAMRLGLTAILVGISTGGALSTLYGWGYFGMGFQIGFAAGLVFGILRQAFSHRREDSPVPIGDSSRWLIVALLTALLAHQIDMSFVFPTGNTSILFWVFAGAIAGRAIGIRQGNGPLEEASLPVAAAEPARTNESWIPSGVLAGALTGGMLVAMLHAFLSLHSFNPVSVWDVLRVSLTQSRLNGGLSHALPLLLVPTWIAANFCILGTLQGASERVRDFKSLALAATLSGTMAVGFALIQAEWIVSVGPVTAATAPVAAAISQAWWFGVLGVTFLALLVAAVVVLAFGLYARSNPRHLKPATPLGSISVALLAVASGILLWPAVVNVERTEAFGKWATILDDLDRKKLAAGVYEYALTIDPRDIPNRILCALAWMDCAEQEKNIKSFSDKMAKAASVLLATRQISELNFANYHLGRIFLRWGSRMQDPQARAVAGQQAGDALNRAIKFAPEAETAWFEASIADRLLLGDIQESNRKLHRADALTAKLDPTSWGDFYSRLAFARENPSLSEFYAARATRYLRDSLTWQPDAPRPKNLSRQEQADLQFNTFRSLVTLARLERLQGNNPSALTDLLEAARIGAKEDVWEAEALLTRLYVEAGKPVIALAHLDLAQASAPENAQRELAALHAQIAKKASP